MWLKRDSGKNTKFNIAYIFWVLLLKLLASGFISCKSLLINLSYW